MKVYGIIAEFNPFHKGHQYLIRQAKQQCDALVVITSSYFTQRGLPSLLLPADKTRLALQAGADLVLELPACFSCQSAAYFAQHAMESLACIPIGGLCFGSESNDLLFLQSMIDRTKHIQKDASKSLAVNKQMDLRPNDILAVEYIQLCQKYKIQPVLFQRQPQYKSATSLRKKILDGDIKDPVFLKDQNWNSYYPFLRNALLLTDREDLQRFHLVTEGIEARLIHFAKEKNTWEDFLQACVTKSYSRARIRRTCMMILLQIKKDAIKEKHFHQLIPLGMNAQGQKLLKQANVRPCVRFKDLPPFYQNVHLKSLALYNSVLSEPVQAQVVIRK